MRLRTCVTAVLCVLGIASARAATVAVSIAQNATAPATAVDMSRTVEGEIMGVFYDSGHIVTSNALSMSDDSFEDASFGVAEASEGYSDYLVAARLTYAKDEITDEALKLTYADLETVSWRVIQLSTGKTIAESTVLLSDFKSEDPDPFVQTRTSARKIAVDSMNAIDRDLIGRY